MPLKSKSFSLAQQINTFEHFCKDCTCLKKFILHAIVLKYSSSLKIVSRLSVCLSFH